MLSRWVHNRLGQTYPHAVMRENENWQLCRQNQQCCTTRPISRTVSDMLQTVYNAEWRRAKWCHSRLSGFGLLCLRRDILLVGPRASECSRYRCWAACEPCCAVTSTGTLNEAARWPRPRSHWTRHGSRCTRNHTDELYPSQVNTTVLFTYFIRSCFHKIVKHSWAEFCDCVACICRDILRNVVLFRLLPAQVILSRWAQWILSAHVNTAPVVDRWPRHVLHCALLGVLQMTASCRRSKDSLQAGITGRRRTHQ